VTNLLDLFAAVTGATVPELEDRYSGKGYGDFKGDLAEAVNGVLRPLRERHAELSDDPEAVTDILRLGATRAREVATTTMQTVRERLGFLR
jgi:tryptophanyl-tRNA synthetase